MEQIKDILRRNGVFVVGVVLVWTALAVAVCHVEKAELHLLLNQWHTPFLDFFFKNITHIGEVGAYIALGCLLFYRLGDALMVISSELASGLVVQIVKHIVKAPRPKVYFDLANNPDILPVVEGVSLHSSNSFPSGHTATFVALFFALCIILSNKDLHIPKWRLVGLQVLLLTIAVLGAYSRIYLSQHFAADVLVGGCIGLVMTLLVACGFKYLEKRYPRFYEWRIKVRREKV